MLKKTTLYAGCAIVAAVLSGCATQQPAPVVAGNSGMQMPSATASNPYGAAPYDAGTAANDAPYVPPVQTASAYTPPAYTPASGGTYAPSYAPVDVNAATHTVVRGDTVYNISKRYSISQDDLRAWNGLADNNISINQVLRVKPAGYVAPKTAALAPSAAPTVAGSAATHTVVHGDTVYNISRRYGISQDDLRSWNGLTDNTISINQVLRVKPAGYVAPKPVVVETKPAAQPAVQPVVQPVAQPAPVAAPAPVVERKVEPVATPAPAPAPVANVSANTRTVSGITWQRPTDGKVIATFGGSNKGVDIAGNAGQPVWAAAEGKVVYAGSGLRGYGNLVIIQHNSSFLTAYGHNQRLLVSEGQQVKRGQQVALMGNTDASRTQLHFEVRQNGKPVNPGSYVAF